MPIELASSPESNLQLTKRIFNLYAASILHVFGLALLLALIAFFPRFVVLAINSAFLSAKFYRVYLIAIELLIVFTFTAMLWRIRCVITNAHERILDDFSIASKKLLLIIGAAAIHLLIILSFSFLMVLLFSYSKNHTTLVSYYIFVIFCAIYFFLMIYINFLFSFYLPIILTENQGIWAAIKKSVTLVWGNWWRVFLLQLLTPASYAVCLLILNEFFSIDIHFYFSHTNATIIATLINLVFLAIFIPLYGATLLVQLRDLELRKAL